MQFGAVLIIYMTRK